MLRHSMKSIKLKQYRTIYSVYYYVCKEQTDQLYGIKNSERDQEYLKILYKIDISNTAKIN